jgi:hypothetical protein
MSPAPPGPRRERGVALLIVLVVLFIVAVLMIDITLTATTARRSAENASSEFLMDAAIEARFQVALAQLRYDYATDQGAVDSPDDRWAREEYTVFERVRTEEEEREIEEAEEASGERLLGDSEDVSVTVTITDEERKFHLGLLAHPEEAKAKEARERFAILLDRFREDTPLDLSRTKAEELSEAVVKYLTRQGTSERARGQVPVPPVRHKSWRLLTPDELRLVPGFEDSSRGLGAEAILYDARDPDEVRLYMEDPETSEPPEVIPGLLRFVTVWSGDSWAEEKEGKAEAAVADSWRKVNLNTAERPVLETLFAESTDYLFAERIVEHRGTQQEGEGPAEGETPDLDEPLAEHQYFKNLEDLKKVDGISDFLARDKAKWLEGYGAFRSGVFSIDILAEHEGAYKQVRYVVRRHAEGFQTLLREERADPRFEAEEPEDEEEEEAPAR